ncbi:tRNA pseudouridine(55) synthase TruB [Lachnospiraceae bacterium NSJ-143]|nr:tRNA pseudouridine(55) synthase TruB [Lachnospiraceae bacterium NSJ-143]
MDGILNIYKEKGFTSHDVVAVVRRTINQKKVGHTGTLDPDAEGVLPICVGKATKLADYIMNTGKTYEAEITLGVETTTQDSSGEVTARQSVDFNEEKIEQAVYSFKGDYMQIPPMYSAVKVNGKKLYELARKGQEIERKARKVEIRDISIIEFMPPDKIKISVDCSKGTYIRTLAADIGIKLGCGAHMSHLVRTRSGKFDISGSITLNTLKEISENGSLSTVLMPMKSALVDYKKIYVVDKADKLMHNGGHIFDYYFDSKSDMISVGDIVAAFDSSLMLNGLYTAEIDEDKKRLKIRPLTILL